MRSNPAFSGSNTPVQHSLLIARMVLRHLETDMLKIERCSKPTFRDKNSEVLVESIEWRAWSWANPSRLKPNSDIHDLLSTRFRPSRCGLDRHQSSTCKLSNVSILSRHLPFYSTDPPQYPLNILLTLRKPFNHLLRQYIPEARKCLTLPLQILITPLHRLDKLSGVYVRVAALVDVVYDLWRETYR